MATFAEILTKKDIKITEDDKIKKTLTKTKK